jgi:hypothetical protein
MVLSPRLEIPDRPTLSILAQGYAVHNIVCFRITEFELPNRFPIRTLEALFEKDVALVLIEQTAIQESLDEGLATIGELVAMRCSAFKPIIPTHITKVKFTES